MNSHRPPRPFPPDYACLEIILAATGELALDATIHSREGLDVQHLEWVDRQLATVCLAVERIVDHLEFWREATHLR
jgi:hypothetical protein